MLLARAAALYQQEFISIPDGARGTRETLKIMGKVVQQARNDPVIRAYAADLVMFCPSGNYRAQVEQCFLFVRDEIRYLQDPVDLERLEYPTVLLETRQGDCDDKATLLAALLESIGHKCRFVAVGYGVPGEFEHVFVETRIGDSWVACETTPIEDMPMVPLGWAPMPPYLARSITSKMTEHI